MTDDILTQKLTYYEHMATEDNAVIARLRTALAEAERERDSLRPSVAEIERDEAIVRAERAEAALATARDVIGELVYLAWTTGPIGRTQEAFKKLPQIMKASAFLKRTKKEPR